MGECHEGPSGGHHSPNRMTQKVLECGFYWPSLFEDAHICTNVCDKCQRAGNISKKDEMPKNFIFVCEIFYIWAIEFVGLFPTSMGCKFILVAIDNVSKWVEAQATMLNDIRVVIKFFKKLFTRLEFLKCSLVIKENISRTNPWRGS